MKFLSNCLGLRDFTLEAFYDKETQLSDENHPHVLKLKLWKNVFTLSFANPEIRNKKSILRSYDYMAVKIEPSAKGKFATYDLSKENRVFLKERFAGEYTREMVENLLDAKNPIVCELRKEMTEMHCRII